MTEQPERWTITVDDQGRNGEVGPPNADHLMPFGWRTVDVVPAAALEAAERERDALDERRLRERRVFADLAERLDARVRRLELALTQAQDDIVDVATTQEAAALATAAFNRITDALSPDETAGEREAEGEGGDDG